MKVNIQYEFHDGAYGGANQFMKALRDYFIGADVYTESVKNADIVLFNSHIKSKSILSLKGKYPHKIFVHRVDGPCKLYNNMKDYRDSIVYALNNAAADATVFQSNYSKNASINMGMPRRKYEAIISNAVNPMIFNSSDKTHYQANDSKVRLIATSFSSNWKKGFKTYQYLDEHLDFSKYEFIFVGNSPVSFKNITIIPPLPSDKLAIELKKSHIYITASEKEPCSNALIEALSCGLPVIALNDGGHPELVKNNGLCFNSNEELLANIEQIANNYDEYVENIAVTTMNKIGSLYINFFLDILSDVQNGKYLPRRMNFFYCIKVYFIYGDVFLKKQVDSFFKIISKIRRKV